MTAPIPVSVMRGINAADGNAARLPITPYDQALAALANDPEALSTACWAGTRIGSTAAPRDLVDGQIFATFGGTTAIIDEDDVIGFTDANGDFVGLPVFDFNGTGGVRNSQTTGKWTQSWSFASIFVPDAGGNGGLAYGVDGPSGGVNNGGSVRTNSTIVYMDTYFNSGVFTSVPRARVTDLAANVIVACADATTRQHALYVNSKTPQLSATGIGTNPWRDLGGISDWGFGSLPGTPYNGRVYSFAGFNRSLHHDADCLPKMLALIDAAAETFGITLV